jgi:hypothetical protein
MNEKNYKVTKAGLTRGGIPYVVEEQRWPRWLSWCGAFIISLLIWGGFYALYQWLFPLVHP